MTQETLTSSGTQAVHHVFLTPGLSAKKDMTAWHSTWRVSVTAAGPDVQRINVFSVFFSGSFMSLTFKAVHGG